ncbi:MAG TPA: hypothetical protein IAA51_04930 [Candidatus Cottocaccamicrobium excrementipullorum]|nr:hypothetical protein [Candidatus Cottocaccamicrobium excrementipullorum]
MRRKVKKAGIGIFAAAMVLLMGTTNAFAAGHRHGRRFADADRIGLCDNARTACCCIDLDNDGICNNCARSSFTSNGWGRNYVDLDGDGVCDHYGTR